MGSAQSSIKRKSKTATHLLLLVCALGLMPSGGSSHGLELSVQQLNDSEAAGLVGERVLDVGEVKTLLAIRSAKYRPGATLMYGMRDLAEQVHFHPAYEHYKAVARERGLELSGSDEEYLAEQTLAFARQLLFEREIRSRIPDPTLEMLRELYEEVKTEYFSTPERLLLQKATVRPLDEADSEKWRDKLHELSERITSGEQAEVLLREHGLAVRSLVLYPDQAPDTELVTLLRGIEDRTALPPRKEDGAWVLYVRRLGLPSGHVPFQSALESLVDLFRFREQDRLVREYLIELAEKPGLIRLLDANLAAEGILALDSDGLLVVAGEIVTRGELRKALGWRLESIGLMDRHELIELMASTGVVQHRLANHLIQDQNLLERPEVRFFRDQLEATMLARMVLVDQALSTPLEVPEAKVLMQWRQERASEGRLPGEVRYDLVQLNPEQKAEEWIRAYESVVDHEGFRRVSNNVMRNDSSALWVSDLRGLLEDLPGDVRRTIGEMQPPGVLVSTEDDQLRAYWINDKVPDENPTQQEFERLSAMVRLYMLQDRIDAILSEYVSSRQIRILLPIED